MLGVFALIVAAIAGFILVGGPGVGDDDDNAVSPTVPTTAPGIQASDGLGKGIVICDRVTNDTVMTSNLTSYDLKTGDQTGSVSFTSDAEARPSSPSGVADLLGCGEVGDDVYNATSRTAVTEAVAPTLDVERQLVAAHTFYTSDGEPSRVGVIDLKTGKFRDLSALADEDEDSFTKTTISDGPPTFDQETGDLVWVRETTSDGSETTRTVMSAPVDGSAKPTEVDVDPSAFETLSGVYADDDLYADVPIMRQPGGNVSLCCAIDHSPTYLSEASDLYRVCPIVGDSIDRTDQTYDSYPNGCPYLYDDGGAETEEHSWQWFIGWLPDGTLLDDGLGRWSYEEADTFDGTNLFFEGMLVPDTSRQYEGVAISPSGDQVLMIVDDEFWLAPTDGTGEPKRLKGVPVGQVVAWTE